MAQMHTNVRRVVSDVSNRVTMLNVLFEAVTNAVQANASHIICRFDTANLEAEEGAPTIRKVIKIEVEDNGRGFDDANYNAFCEYRTDHKEDLGCKGIGRFQFLKIFRRVQYESWVRDSQEMRTFSFDLKSGAGEMSKESAEVSANRTVLRLSDPTDHCYSPAKHSDRRIEFDLQVIQQDILSHLVPTLFLHYRQKRRTIQIDLIDQSLPLGASGQKMCIADADIPDFASADFELVDNEGGIHKFILYHTIAPGTGSLKAFHCSNGRTVCRFSEHDLDVTLPGTYSGYFLLVSDYLDHHVDNDRNDFSIFPVRTDFVSPLSWELINSRLKQVISGLVRAQIPQAVEMNSDKLDEILQERPYLAEYIAEEDLDIAGFIDKAQIIRKAKKRFETAKDNLLLHAGRPEYSDEDLQDAIQVAQNELVAYIQDRVFVIDRLKTMLHNKEENESLIHNLFMERYSEDDYESVKRNNLWLLDDRFTSYSYAASEKRIGEILRKVGLNGGSPRDGERPDLALFCSHDPVNKIGLKAVLIEIKPFKEDSLFDRDKFAGIQQLIDYIMAFRSQEGFEEIWAFLMTDVDDKLAARLQLDGYIPTFSLDRAIYCRYYGNIPAFIHVLGVKTLISDAEARNRGFIEIINSKNRMRRILGEASDAGRGA